MKKRVLSILASVTLLTVLAAPCIPSATAEEKTGVAWSADLREEAGQLATWQYSGKNNAGQVVTQNFDELDADCPLAMTAGEANAFGGTGIHFQYTFPEGTQAEHYHNARTLMIVDLDEYPNLYIKSKAPAPNVWYDLFVGATLDSLQKLGDMQGEAEKAYDLTEVFPEGGVQMLWLSLALVDADMGSNAYDFDYLFVGNDTAFDQEEKPPVTANPEIAWSADAGEGSEQFARWQYFGKNNAGQVVSQNFDELNADCPLAMTPRAANDFQGTGLRFQYTFSEGTQADSFHTARIQVTVDLDKHSYLYFQSLALPENVWFGAKAGRDPNALEPLEEGNITAAATKQYDLRTVFPEGGVQTFWIGLTMVDATMTGQSIDFDYLLIGSDKALEQEEKPHVTADPEIAWSADAGEGSEQFAQWQYFGKNNAGEVVSQNFNELDADCPLAMTPREANDFQGTGIRFKYNFSEGTQADPFNTARIQVTADLDKHPYLYMKSGFLAGNVWYEPAAGENADALTKLGLVNAAATTKHDLRTVFPEGGVQTFWIGLILVDATMTGQSIDFDYLFIGSEAADPEASVGKGDILWSADLTKEAGQRPDWVYYGKDRTGAVVSDTFAVDDLANRPIHIASAVENNFYGSDFTVKFDWSGDSKADFYQKMGYKLTVDTDKYPFLYADVEFEDGDLFRLAPGATVQSEKEDPTGGSAQGARVYNLKELFGGGEQSIFVVLDVQDINKNSSVFKINYLYVGNENAAPPADDPDPDDPDNPDNPSDPDDPGAADLIDDATGITAQGDFPAGSSLSALPVEDEAQLAFIEHWMEGKLADWKAYDLAIQQFGVNTDVPGGVTFTIPVPDGVDADEAAIYRLADDGTATRIEATAADGALSFTTEEYGLYIIGKSLVKDGSPDTGAALPAAVILLAVGAGAVLLLAKRRK